MNFDASPSDFFVLLPKNMFFVYFGSAIWTYTFFLYFAFYKVGFTQMFIAIGTTPFCPYWRTYDAVCYQRASPLLSILFHILFELCRFFYLTLYLSRFYSVLFLLAIHASFRKCLRYNRFLFFLFSYQA